MLRPAPQSAEAADAVAVCAGAEPGCGRGDRCGGGGHSTPAGTSQVTITGTSGQLTQTATFGLTVQ
jgi:hypothetical protein